MAQSKSIVFAHLFHITWKDDCLIFPFARSKTNQMGKNRDQLWHVYATPMSPATFPCLSLVCYMFANPGLRDSDGDGYCWLFPGGGQYGWFMDCL
jgi:hypothetical protein